jgi:hypothetical protein
MKISELVESLIDIKNVNGDIEVKMDNLNDDWTDYCIYELDVVEFDEEAYVVLR